MGAWRGVTHHAFTPRPTSTTQGGFLWLAARRLVGGRAREAEMRSILAKTDQLAAAGRWELVINYNQEPGFAWHVARICRHRRLPFFQQYTELHLPGDFDHGWLCPIYLREQLHYRLAPRWSAGDIAISTLLANGCARGKSRSSFIVPALTDTEGPGRPTPTAPATPFTFTYLGAGERRDCLELVLEVAASLATTHQGWRIRLAGLGKARLEWVRRRIDQAGLSGWVEALGWLTDAERDRVFREAGAFFLLRTDDRSSRACFPTRLPEYMDTGRPVVVSRVGDIPLYLKDGEDALLPQPMDLAGTTAAFASLLDRQGFASALGANGRLAAQREFGYQQWGRRLASYLEGDPHVS